LECTQNGPSRTALSSIVGSYGKRGYFEMF
jgi:hypothetical protein